MGKSSSKLNSKKAEKAQHRVEAKSFRQLGDTNSQEVTVRDSQVITSSTNGRSSQVVTDKSRLSTDHDKDYVSKNELVINSTAGIAVTETASNGLSSDKVADESRVVEVTRSEAVSQLETVVISANEDTQVTAQDSRVAPDSPVRGDSVEEEAITTGIQDFHVSSAPLSTTVANDDPPEPLPPDSNVDLPENEINHIIAAESHNILVESLPEDAPPALPTSSPPIETSQELSDTAAAEAVAEALVAAAVAEATEIAAEEQKLKAEGQNLTAVPPSILVEAEITVLELSQVPAMGMTNGKVQVVACEEGVMKNGEMCEVEIGESKVLLVRSDGQYYAIGSKCTHFGAPLSKGVLCNGHVRCPFHGARFSIKTGDIEEYPGLDSVPTFEVFIRNGKVMISADKEALTNFKRTKQMCSTSDSDPRTFLIIGGGPASVTCAETLRQEGFTGKVVIATREAHLPYDRTKLTKAMESSATSIALRPAEFYQKYDIEFIHNKDAASVDCNEKCVTFADGDSISYDSLLIATGSNPRVLPIPGHELNNVFVLRTPDDANKIAAEANDKNVVIIGSSFIGMEVTAGLAETSRSVTLVDIISIPFEQTLGKTIGSTIQKLHEEKNVKFYMNAGVAEFVGDGNKVTEVLLTDGTRLRADVCLLGVGVVPSSDFVKDSGIEMNKQGYVCVDKNMRTNKSDVFAAGDVTEFPLFTHGDVPAVIGHWQMAHHHGRVAAFNMLGKSKDLRSVPFFWTVQYGKSVRYTGYSAGYDDVLVHGYADELKFAAFYIKGEDVVAVASLNHDPIVSQAAEMMAAGLTITKKDILEDPSGFVKRLPQK